MDRPLAVVGEAVVLGADGDRPGRDHDPLGAGLGHRCGVRRRTADGLDRDAAQHEFLQHRLGVLGLVRGHQIEDEAAREQPGVRSGRGSR